MNLHLAACGSFLVTRAGGSPVLKMKTTRQRGLRAGFLGFLFSDSPVLPQVKCEHYWPLDSQPCTYGHLQVTLEGEKVMENWTVRDLKLRHVSPPPHQHHAGHQFLPQDIPGIPSPELPRKSNMLSLPKGTPGMPPPVRKQPLGF